MAAAKKQETGVVRLTHINGAEVTVPEDRADALLARGFTKGKAPAKPASK